MDFIKRVLKLYIETLKTIFDLDYLEKRIKEKQEKMEKYKNEKK